MFKKTKLNKCSKWSMVRMVYSSKDEDSNADDSHFTAFN